MIDLIYREADCRSIIEGRLELRKKLRNVVEEGSESGRVDSTYKKLFIVMIVIQAEDCHIWSIESTHLDIVLR